MDAMGTTSRLVIHFPDQLWLGSVSREFPYLQFEIKSFIPISQEPFIGNSLIKITGNNPLKILPRLKGYKSLKSFFLMEKSNTHIVLNTQTKDQFLLKSIVKNTILVKFPVIVTKGIAEFVINASRINTDKFIQSLHDRGIKAELKSIGTYTDDIAEQILTPRQHEVYLSAKKYGYYDSPRAISLSEMAEKLNIAKSSLSTMLQRIHKRLLGT